MFCSKVSPLLRNIASSHDNGYTNLLQYALCSTKTTFVSTSPAQQQPAADKLYKKIEIEVRGNDAAVLKSYGQFAVMAAEHLSITVGRNTTPLKPIHERLTLLKSVFVHKNHRVQYESRTYYRYLDFFKLTGSTADTFLEYLQRNLPEGVAMKTTRVELQTLPEALTHPPSTTKTTTKEK
ncbi:28S ribosomal protein S10, mitochondrial [Hylaeus volcanicus]|uniref:28S ribosomal protein S10, mitochondrial n=1 Tax=Hylaeus volcanicus TaxID=313075 RepID=UPI0023B85C51|nr:28S ribosomal protein S10, mitochondrial [Hylaeus volcanicus]